MTCKTTRQLLDQIRNFHRQLSAYYTDTAADVDREKVAMLLEYMARHEDHLEQCLARYEEGAAKKVLDTWFQFMPEIAKCECFDRIDVNQDMSVADVVRVALWFDDCLIQFFREMADVSVSDDVKEVFRDLASMEEQEKHTATRASLELTQGG